MSFDDHPNLKLVDTTGAGDTYTAAFGVRLNEILGVKRQNGEGREVSDEEHMECM